MDTPDFNNTGSAGNGKRIAVISAIFVLLLLGAVIFFALSGRKEDSETEASLSPSAAPSSGEETLSAGTPVPTAPAPESPAPETEEPEESSTVTEEPADTADEPAVSTADAALTPAETEDNISDSPAVTLTPEASGKTPEAGNETGNNTSKKATATPTPTTKPVYSEGTVLGNEPAFSLNKYFYTTQQTLKITVTKKGTIYYTTDGSVPTKKSSVYNSSTGIVLKAKDTSKTYSPNATVIRAKAFYDDGSESPVATHTYFISSSISSRYSNYIFCVTGDPADLTDSSTGILAGSSELRGSTSEREIYLEVLNSTGTKVLAQACGARPYGGASRKNAVKSIKLFARTSYGGPGKFNLGSSFFGTKASDGTTITKYDKLVLRQGGNDFQFGFVRDELNQTLLRNSGAPVTEGVVPVVVYVNGTYYGLLWLHESYCDDYFKDLFPQSSAKGDFVVLEGSDQTKNSGDEDSTLEKNAVSEYNKLYKKYAYSDLTNDTNYNALSKLIDVDNYLDYFAFNIYINNWDWPNNNYKCYRYYAASGESYKSSGAYDGKWRFLPHDMDFSEWLYGDPNDTTSSADTTNPAFNNLAVILDSTHDRYSPLFAALMKRTDCREAFISKVLNLADGTLSYSNINSTLNALKKKMNPELEKYLLLVREKIGNQWWPDYNYVSNTCWNGILQFAKTRKSYMVKYLASCFGMTEAEVTALK